MQTYFWIPFSVASNHRQASDIMNTSQQGSSSDVDSARLENGDTERSPSASNSLRPRTGKRVLRPTTGQALRPSRKKPSHKDGQPQPVASASLGPVHSSKVSKATGKKSRDLSDGRTPLKRCSPVTHHCYLAQILLNHYPRLLAYPHEEANG